MERENPTRQKVHKTNNTLIWYSIAAHLEICFPVPRPHNPWEREKALMSDSDETGSQDQLGAYITSGREA